MVYKSLVGVTCACLAVVSFSANSALVSRLGGLAYYDTEADLTWLADAHPSYGTTYDYAYPGEGYLNWADANAWAADLVVGGSANWRLPTTTDNCHTYGETEDLNVCSGSEMGNLYFNVLGNSLGGVVSNEGPFSNVYDGWATYWSSTETLYYDSQTGNTYPLIMQFDMGLGFQGGTSVGTSGAYAWAVQSGDVGVVPVPAAVWLFGSGLIGLISVARRKKA